MSARRITLRFLVIGWQVFIFAWMLFGPCWPLLAPAQLSLSKTPR